MKVRRAAERCLLVVLMAAATLISVPQVAQASTPVITSANNTTFTVGVTGTFTVTTTGSPLPSLSESGTLPSGVTFVDKGNGTATLSGKVPNSTYVGPYILTITAHNTSGNGTQTFTLTVSAGTMSITVPSSVSLGSATPGGSVTAHLGTVTITDNRFDPTDAWTVTVSSTTFTTGGGTAPQTVPLANVSYWSGPLLTHTGNGLFTSGQPNSSSAADLTSARTAFTHTAGTLASAATFNPTLIITVPTSDVAGTYTGTVTHSVA